MINKSKQVVEAIKEAQKFVSKDCERAALNHIYFEFDGNRDSVTITATNGHVLYSRCIKNILLKSESTSFVFDIAKVNQLIKDDKDFTSLREFKEEFGHATEQHYPNYKMGIPEDFIHEVRLSNNSISDFKDEVSSMKHIVSKKTNMLKLAQSGVDTTEYSFLAESTRFIGTIRGKQTMYLSNAFDAIGFNVKYLELLFKTALSPTNKKLFSAWKWGFNTSQSATVLKSDTDNGSSILLIMPLRIYK